MPGSFYPRCHPKGWRASPVWELIKDKKRLIEWLNQALEAFHG